MADVIADMTAYSNQALLDAAEWAGVSVWSVIGAIAGAVLLILIIVVWLIERKHRTLETSYKDIEIGGYIEKTLAEFSVDMIKTKGGEGKIVVKLITPKPKEEALLPQKVKGEPLPTAPEVPKPPAKKEKEKKEEPKSEPIAMGSAGN